MPSTQDTVITALIADALAIERTPEQGAALGRRRDTGTLADRLQALGGTMGVSYLRRRLDDDGLTDALEATTAPLVLYSDVGTDAVVLGRGRDESPLIVSAHGVVQSLSVTGTALREAVQRAVGATPHALSPLALAAPHDPMRTTLEMMVDTRSHSTAAVRPKMGVFARVIELLARDRRDIVILFVYAALAGLFALTLPLSIGAIVQLVQGGLILQPVVILIGYVVVGTFVSGWLQVLQLAIVERIQQRVFARMALEFTFRVPRVRYETAMREDLPETMNRLFEAVNIQKSLSKFLLDTSTALLTVVAGLLLLTFYHPYFSFFGVLLLVVLGGILWFSGPRGLETSLMESKYKYASVHWLEEQARAFHAFKFAGRSPLGVQRMDEVLSGYLTYRRKHFRVLMQQTISIVLFRTIIVGGFLVLGVRLVIDRQISLGQFVASEFVIVTIMLGIEKLILSMSTIYDILTSSEKAGHVSDLPLDAVGGVVLPPSTRGMAVDLRRVGYRYAPGSPLVLANISLRLAPGERVALTGYEGAGRTTLLRLISGLLGDFDGALVFDGQPFRMLDVSVLREAMGQYMSTAGLFDGTIEENIAVGRPGIGADEVRAAIDAVGLTADIEDMPHGIHTIIEQGGRRLPQGTAIKLLFAQTIAGAPRLLVVDDLFQNLQSGDRQRLISLLTDPQRTWTVVVVSHDLELLSAMDRVIVMADGLVRQDAPLAELTDDPYIAHLLEFDSKGKALAGHR